jgi:Do/DeqQ family serine protease
MKQHLIALASAAALGVAAFSSSPALAAPPLGAEMQIADAAEKALPSVVNISTTTLVRQQGPEFSDPFFRQFFGQGGGDAVERGHSLGSGVVVSAKGYILTNNHVVANGTDIKVQFGDGREVDASVVGADPKSDLAVLKLKGNFGKLTPITFGDSTKLRLGEVVIAIGDPLGVGQSVTMGIISAKGRETGMTDYQDFLQTDAAINPGNSGGALVNLRGELIGINAEIASQTGGYQGIGFAIPTEMARPIMDSLIASGKVTRGWLGVSIQDLSHELAETLGIGLDHGVLLSGVLDGGPAARAGLKRGDVVVRIGPRQTEKTSQLRNAVASLGVGKKVELEYVRDGKHQIANVVLAEQPANLDKAGNQDGPGDEGDQGEVIGGGEPSGGHAGLGLRATTLDAGARKKYDIPKDVTRGVVVTGVARDGVAAEIGIQPGDVIVQVNRTAVKSPKQLEEAYRSARGKLAFLVSRQGQTVYVVIEKQ